MLFGNDRNQLRAIYFETWRKYEAGEPLEPLEKQIAAVILEHPEYHIYLEDYEGALARDFLPESGESNPFLHMGLHLAIHEQLSTNRPAGVVGIHRQLQLRHGSAHEAEHRMIECLAETLWEAQREGGAPDEERYLQRLRKLVELR